MMSTKSAAAIWVCWNASWKNTIILRWYSGSFIQSSISSPSASGSAVTRASSASLGGSPTRMFLTFATYTDGGSGTKVTSSSSSSSPPPPLLPAVSVPHADRATSKATGKTPIAERLMDDLCMAGASSKLPASQTDDLNHYRNPPIQALTDDGLSGPPHSSLQGVPDSCGGGRTVSATDVGVHFSVAAARCPARKWPWGGA